MIYLNPTPYPSQPLCASCGRHAVERIGQLCCVDDKDDTWNCALKAAYFAARWRGIVWEQTLPAQAEILAR